MGKTNSNTISFQVIAAVAVIVAGCLAIVLQLPDLQSLNNVSSGVNLPQNALSQDALSNIGTLILISVLVAVVEEIVFRGILLEWLNNKFQKASKKSQNKSANRNSNNALNNTSNISGLRGIVFAIVISSAIFALFHALPIGATTAALPSFIPETYSAVWIALSLLLKFMQAFFFGVILSALRFLPSKQNSYTQHYSSSTNMWKFLLFVIVLHALFDILYFAVPVIATGQFPQTYVINTNGVLISTCITTIIFALTGILAYLRLRQTRQHLPM